MVPEERNVIGEDDAKRHNVETSSRRQKRDSGRALSAMMPATFAKTLIPKV